MLGAWRVKELAEERVERLEGELYGVEGSGRKTSERAGERLGSEGIEFG